MSYAINFFGWNNTEGHDKVWGYVTIGEGSTAELYNFWGKRGKRLAFKKFPTGYGSAFELSKLSKKKAEKGYQEYSVAEIDKVCEGFIDQFEKELTLAKLFDNFRGRPVEGGYS
jgi:predicted DNA-binding WGR domain protein